MFLTAFTADAGKPGGPRGAASELKHFDAELSHSLSGCVYEVDGATGSSFLTSRDSHEHASARGGRHEQASR